MTVAPIVETLVGKEVVREVARGDEHQLRKSADCKAQVSPVCGTSALLICAL